MAGELDFGALHHDDRLLDALAARHDFGSDDPVAYLLAAFAADVDAVPVPLSEAFGAGGLLARPAPARSEVAAAERVAAAAGSGMLLTRPVDLDQDSPGAAPPVAVPLVGRRRRRMVLSRAAAMTGVAAVVLGVGGVAAAVGGGVGPLQQHIRDVVASVTEQVAPNHSRQNRVENLLADADSALKSADAITAAVLLADARTRLATLDGDAVATLTSRLVSLEARLAGLQKDARNVVGGIGVSVADRTRPAAERAPAGQKQVPATTAAVQGGVPAQQGPFLPGESPTNAAESPADARGDGITQNLPGPDFGNPADNLPGAATLPAEDKIGETETDLQHKVDNAPKPLPDELGTPAGPVHPWRSPSSIGVLDDPTVHQVAVDVAPAAGEAANRATGGRP